MLICDLSLSLSLLVVRGGVGWQSLLDLGFAVAAAVPGGAHRLRRPVVVSALVGLRPRKG